MYDGIPWQELLEYGFVGNMLLLFPGLYIILMAFSNIASFNISLNIL